MNQGKHGFKTFVLTLLAALGLMVFMAASAQANWLYLDSFGETKELTLNSESAKVIQHTEDVTFLIERVNLAILCKNIKSEYLDLFPGSAISAEAAGEILFSGCVAIEKKPGKKCQAVTQSTSRSDGAVSPALFYTLTVKTTSKSNRTLV